MNLSTHYLNLDLRSPLVASASPLSQTLDSIKRLEESGAAAVVLHSLFEEQLSQEREVLFDQVDSSSHLFAEAQSYFPQLTEYRLDPDHYLNHIRLAKEAVQIPIIASLNGTSIGGWTTYARDIQDAGADALELNIYSIPSNPTMGGQEIEDEYVSIVRAVRRQVTIPIAVKLSPYLTNVAQVIHRMAVVGADGFVLFNRFYQPDIDLDTLEVMPRILLSTEQEMRLPLRWIAMLWGRVRADLAATSGIQSGTDVVKMLLVGAQVTMMCSALLKHGPGHIATVEQDLVAWLETHDYQSVDQLRGSLSQHNAPNPSLFERAQYIKALQGYRLTEVARSTDPRQSS